MWRRSKHARYFGKHVFHVDLPVLCRLFQRTIAHRFLVTCIVPDRSRRGVSSRHAEVRLSNDEQSVFSMFSRSHVRKSDELVIVYKNKYSKKDFRCELKSQETKVEWPDILAHRIQQRTRGHETRKKAMQHLKAEIYHKKEDRPPPLND